MASRSTSPGPTESVFSADESFTPLGSEFGTDGYEGSVGRGGPSALAAAAGPVDLSQLNLVSLNRPWNEPGESNRQAFHAISTVLSHPTRKPAPLRASRVPLPPAPPPDPIPRVNRKDIDAYLALVGPEWDRYEAAMTDGGSHAAGLDVGAALEERRTSSSAITTPSLRSIPDVFFSEDFNLGNPHTFELVTSLAGPGAAAPPRRHSLASPNASFASLPPILEPLDEADTSFSTVDGGTDVAPSPETSTPIDLDDTDASQQLQARLSTHLGLVEQHLVLEISQRSASFFAALTNLQDLQTESESCLSRIESLQLELRALDEGVARKGLEAVALSRSLRGLKAVDSAVKELRSIDEAVAMARQLLANDDVYGALDLWEEVDGWLKRRGKAKDEADAGGAVGRRRKSSTVSRFRSPSVLGEVAEDGEEEGEDGGDSTTPTSAALLAPRLRRHESSSSSTLTLSQPAGRSRHKQPDVDLTASAALAQLPQTLAALSLSIAAQLELELTGFLGAELGHREQAADVPLEERLRPLLSGLIRARESGRIVGVFREVALAEVREAAKKFVSEASDASAAALSKRLKGMSHVAFLAMEVSMFDALLDCLRAVDTTAKAVEAVLSEVSSGPTSGFTLTSSLTQELQDVLTTSAELAHSRASKVMGVRTDQHALLPLEQFIGMFNAAWSFVVDCEVLCRKMIVGLRGTMVVQAKTFLQTYHSQRLSSSARLVENEIWSPEEPSAAQQHALDLIVEAAVSDPPELVMPKDGSAPPAASSNGTTLAEKGSTTLHIEGRAFFVVPATSASVELLVDYLRLVINIDLVTTDVMAKVIEYLKSFNSRTCQVVLGAGAMRSAGLKNITAKHLGSSLVSTLSLFALASQSLSVMVTLIPYIREAVRRHLSAKQAVMLVEFDKLKRDYQEHQNEIHAKLVAIMGDRLAIHVTSFHDIDWEAPAPKAGKPSDYVELLIKETSQLHKILSKYLPESAVELVISQVFASINNGLAEAFAGVELKSDVAKSRLALDAMHLVKKLSALPNVTPIPATLPTLVKDKPVPRRPVGASMQNLMRRVSSQGKIGDGFEGSDKSVDSSNRAGDCAPDLLAPPGASSLGTPSSSLNPSEAPSPSADSADRSPYTEQSLETALQAVVSPLNLPRRSSSLAPSPLALGSSSPLPPLPPSPAGGDPLADPLLAPEAAPDSIARDEPAPKPPLVEAALPPNPSISQQANDDEQPDAAPPADVLDATPSAPDVIAPSAPAADSPALVAEGAAPAAEDDAAAHSAPEPAPTVPSEPSAPADVPADDVAVAPPAEDDAASAVTDEKPLPDPQPEAEIPSAIVDEAPVAETDDAAREPEAAIVPPIADVASGTPSSPGVVPGEPVDDTPLAVAVADEPVPSVERPQASDAPAAVDNSLAAADSEPAAVDSGPAAAEAADEDDGEKDDGGAEVAPDAGEQDAPEEADDAPVEADEPEKDAGAAAPAGKKKKRKNKKKKGGQSGTTSPAVDEATAADP